MFRTASSVLADCPMTSKSSRVDSSASRPAPKSGSSEQMYIFILKSSPGRDRGQYASHGLRTSLNRMTWRGTRPGRRPSRGRAEGDDPDHAGLARGVQPGHRRCCLCDSYGRQFGGCGHRARCDRHPRQGSCKTSHCAHHYSLRSNPAKAGCVESLGSGVGKRSWKVPGGDYPYRWCCDNEDSPGLETDQQRNADHGHLETDQPRERHDQQVQTDARDRRPARRARGARGTPGAEPQVVEEYGHRAAAAPAQVAHLGQARIPRLPRPHMITKRTVSGFAEALPCPGTRCTRSSAAGAAWA